MNKKIIFSIALAICFGTACVKNTLFDTDNEIVTPEIKAFILINIDWEDTQEDNQVQPYTLSVGNSTYAIEKYEQPDTIPVELGEYEVRIYNTPLGISVSEEEAKVNYDAENNIIPNPYSFYFAKENVNASSENTYTVELMPTKKTKELVIYLENLTDSLPPFRSLYGYIDDIAGSYDLNTEIEINSERLGLNFITDSCTANIFGTLGDQHSLHLEMTYEDDAIRTTEIDISDHLIDFNLNKKEPKQIIIGAFELYELYY